jgi:hypothetical protein
MSEKEKLKYVLPKKSDDKGNTKDSGARGRSKNKSVDGA